MTAKQANEQLAIIREEMDALDKEIPETWFISYELYKQKLQEYGELKQKYTAVLRTQPFIIERPQRGDFVIVKR